MKTFLKALAASIFLFFVFISIQHAEEKNKTIRVGYFPNITHAQAVIGASNGFFQEKIGQAAKVEWQLFNAGPSVIEALFAGHVDIAYIGPSPAVNGYVKSQGESLKIIAGSASGGAALVVQENSGIKATQDFHGKKIATPQLGNTQDVALKSWLLDQGLKLSERGGDVSVLAVANPDQVTLFQKRELDGAWTVEPWVSILEETAGGKIYFEESSLWPGGSYATTVLIVRTKFLNEHPDLVKSFLKAHVEMTRFIHQYPEKAKKILSETLETLTHKAIPPTILEASFSRIQFTESPMKLSVSAQAKNAFRIGFFKKDPNLSTLFETNILDEVLKELGPELELDPDRDYVITA